MAKIRLWDKPQQQEAFDTIIAEELKSVEQEKYIREFFTANWTSWNGWAFRAIESSLICVGRLRKRDNESL